MAVTSSGKATVTLPTDEQILITREFDAPRHLVYEAWTTPELVKRWWSGQRGAMTIAEIGSPCRTLGAARLADTFHIEPGGGGCLFGCASLLARVDVGAFAAEQLALHDRDVQAALRERGGGAPLATRHR